MLSTESSDEDLGRQNSGNMSLSSKVETLTSTLQDTNRNLRAVDKMLERYRDIGEEKSAVVAALKKDLQHNEEKLCHERSIRRTGSCGEFAGHTGHTDHIEPTDLFCHHRPSSTPLQRNTFRRNEDCTGLAVHCFDDSDIADRHLHTLHQSIRDLSSEQRRLQQELDQERHRRMCMETDKKTSAAVSESANKITNIKQLETLENELRADRELWKARHDDLCKVSTQLKQALLDRHQSQKDLSAMRTQPVCNLLVIGDTDKEKQQSKIHSDRLNHEPDTLNEHRLKGLENSLSLKDLQLSQTFKQMEDVQRAADITRQQMSNTISELRQRLQEMKSQAENSTVEMETLRNLVYTERTKNEHLKQQLDDKTQQCKTKYKSLEKELEKYRHSCDLRELKNTELERELESLRTHGGLGGASGQHFEQLKRQFTDLLGIRVHLEEQVRIKDVEVNQLKSVKLDLEKDLRDSRKSVDKLENELHSIRERLYLVNEEKNRLEHQMNSVHSNVYTSDQQLQRTQKDLQDANVNCSHLSAQLAKMAADNQELKMKLQEHQKQILTDREEINGLRQKLYQIVQQEVSQADKQRIQDNESSKFRELSRQLKTERAEYYAHLQTLKVELDEERACSTRYKSQVETLKVEIDELTQQLLLMQDATITQQRYVKMRHDLLNNSAKHEDLFEKQTSEN